MITPDLLSILCCPETRQELALAPSELVVRINRQISAGALRNHGGEAVREPIDGGLLRADGKVLYPVRNGIPIMLVSEAISLEA